MKKFHAKFWNKGKPGPKKKKKSQTSTVSNIFTQFETVPPLYLLYQLHHLDISFTTQRPPPVFLDPISTSLSTSYLSTYSEMEIVLL